LAEMQKEDVPTRAERAGQRLRRALEALPAVAGVRGLGLLLAAELEELDGRQVAAAALQDGLVVNGVSPTAVRLAPSLLVTDEQVDEAVAILSGVLDQVGATT
jgi:acetylornithine/N-succinyldiaminopimelate aminotransferase